MFGPKSKKPEANHRTSDQVATKPGQAPTTDAEANPASESYEMENVISKGTIINGNIVAEGDLLIEGIVRGDVDTKSTLVVGPTCVIEGNIVAENVEVAGQVKGMVKATGLLVIKSSSMIDGDVMTKNLNVESGSTFNGKFTVGSVTNTPLPKKTDTAALANTVRPPVPVASPAPSKA